MKRFILTALAATMLTSSAMAQVSIHFDFGPPPPRGSFWDGAPPTLPERIHIVDMRMQRLYHDGLINPNEWNGDRDEWNRINILNQELTRFEGGALSEREHNWLWNRLNNLSNRLHWQANLGY